MGRRLNSHSELGGREQQSFPRELLAGDVQSAARSLLGSLLISGSVSVRITEVEAYGGAEDPASHAWRGATARNDVMFGPPGHAYVYFSYGVHWCINVTTGPVGSPSAVLIRAGTVVAGHLTAAERRPGISLRDQARGPGRLCRTLDIGKAAAGLDLCAADSALRLAQGEHPTGTVRSGPRVGVSRAADRPWRLWVDGEPTVSAYRRSPRADPLPDCTP